MMKKLFIALILTACNLLIYSQIIPPVYSTMFNWVTEYTPTGESFEAGELNYAYELTQKQKDDIADYYLWAYPGITLLGEATRSYNCHGYAWWAIEGEDDVWINGDNSDHFWDSNKVEDPTYKKTTSHADKAKIVYYGIDHSAIATNHVDTVISKWYQYPLFKHHIDDMPWNDTDSIEYYILIPPDISGITDTLCENAERIFTADHDFSNFDVDYDWSVSGDLEEVSGDGTDTYTVEGTSNYGSGSVSLKLISPSGCSSATVSTGNFHIGVPNPVDNILCVYCYQYCQGQEYIFQVEDDNDPFTTSYYWTVNYVGHITYGQGGPSVSIYFDYPYQAIISVYAVNTCGYSNVKTKNIMVEDCGYKMMVYPNPAKDEITFSIDEKSELSEDAIYVISDNNMTKLVTEPLKSKEKTINISGLKSGLYYISVYTNGRLMTEKFIKE